MNQLLQQCADFFAENEWHFETLPDSQWLKTSFDGDNGRWQALVVCDDDEVAIKFMSIFPSKVKTAMIPKAAELAARINHQIRYGSLHLDVDNGDLCFVTTLFASAKVAEVDDIKHMIFSNLCILDRHYDVIMKVIHGGLLPKDALAMAGEKETKPKHQHRFNLN